MRKLSAARVDPTLVWAAKRGYLLLPDEAVDGATAVDGLLRFNPRLSPTDLRAVVENAIYAAERV